MPAIDPRWRVSVATLDRLLLPVAGETSPRLILERMVSIADGPSARVHAKPFGGAVRILDAAVLHRHIGEFEFDSLRSRSEQDFRILIDPSDWDRVAAFCLENLLDPQGGIIETSPQRELTEEFMDVLRIDLQPGQVCARSAGLVVENKPVPTGNRHSLGVPTVRVYHVFEVEVLDQALGAALLENSRLSDLDLQALAAIDAARDGEGRLNAILALPLHTVYAAALDLPEPLRALPFEVDGHLIEPSVLALFAEITAPQYVRLAG